MPEKSLIELLAERAVKAGGHEVAPVLYRMVAEQIRARLYPEDAAVVAAWFERLADCEDPQKIFVTKSRGGRPRKRSTPERRDDYDIAWIVHLAIVRKIAKPTEVYRQVGKAHGLKPGSVRNIYSKLKPEIEKLHKNLP